MRKHRSSVVFIFGVIVGAALVKQMPKTYAAKSFVLAKESVKAINRLNKILIEENYRIDDAIEAENQFINLLSQDIGFTIEFTIIDKGYGPYTTMRISNKAGQFYMNPD